MQYLAATGTYKRRENICKMDKTEEAKDNEGKQDIGAGRYKAAEELWEPETFGKGRRDEGAGVLTKEVTASTGYDSEEFKVRREKEMWKDNLIQCL